MFRTLFKRLKVVPLTPECKIPRRRDDPSCLDLLNLYISCATEMAVCGLKARWKVCPFWLAITEQRTESLPAHRHKLSTASGNHQALRQPGRVPGLPWATGSPLGWQDQSQCPSPDHHRRFKWEAASSDLPSHSKRSREKMLSKLYPREAVRPLVGVGWEAK